jgi:DivIVA domain-containing protein
MIFRWHPTTVRPFPARPGSRVPTCHATIDTMAHLLLIVLGVLVVGAVAYGVTWIVTGRDSGLDPETPDGRAVPLPTTRPLTETDIETIRFDTTLRGYRMDQVDAALRRAAYDLGYKEELIEVLEAEIAAIRAGRTDEAEELRTSRESSTATGRPATAGDWTDVKLDGEPDPIAPDAVKPDDVKSAEVADDAVDADTTARASSGR